MSPELSKTYEASSVEPKWQEHWHKEAVYRTRVNPDKKPYVIYIPPPNVTGVLHMGHVLNYTIQDVLTRWKRMQGFEALWLPGLDHAGIATQNVVEKALRKEGKSRHDLGREKFVERVWQWKEEHGGTILDQFRKLGASFDLERLRFTLDEDYSRAVLEVFVRLHEKGLVYRGNYIASWCPRCQTVLSDEEVDHVERNGKLWHVRYPLTDGSGHVEVATTRPETMLGDTGVAIHPDNPKTNHLKGKKALLPLLDRELPIVEDERVDPEFGTGAVKMTPAHDPLDFEIGKDHGLEPIKIFEPDATVKDGIGRFGGLSREEARKEVLKDLEAGGFLVKDEKHRNSIGICYRCETVVEPWLSEQWFIAMKKLAEPAAQAVRDGEVTIFPERWEKVYFHWMDNIRDWCVSRQLWWGHRIPAWYCDACDTVHVSIEAPAACTSCAKTAFRQDEDVLDTWASSWLWPFATLGWPQKTPELQYFFPSNILVTGSEIIFFWVARMIMASLEFMGEVPFKEVFLHGIVRDQKGRKLSKSLGNSPDTLEILKKYGADAVRFSTILTTPSGQDAIFSEEKLDTGRRFANKIWNATRFVMPHIQNVSGLSSPPESLPLPERWLLSRLTEVQGTVTAHLDKSSLNEAAYAVYDFLWHDYCDWFVEMSKGAMADEENVATRETLLHALREGVRLLAPFMPHLSEELGTHLGFDGLVSLSAWNDGAGGFRDPGAEIEMEIVQELVTAIRTIRSESNVPPNERVNVYVRFLDDTARDPANREREHVLALAKAENLHLDGFDAKPSGCIAMVTRRMEVAIPLEGLVDLDKERERLQKEVERLTGLLASVEKKLGNENYVKRAPEEVVAKDRERASRTAEMLDRVEQNLASLSR